MYTIRGILVGEDEYGNIKRKPVKMGLTHLPDETDMPYSLSGLVNLCNLMGASVTIYDGKRKIEDVEFISDEVNSCEAENIMELLTL